MTRSLDGMSVEELVARFEANTLAQDRALSRDEVRQYNRLIDQMEAIERELESRDGDQRSALMRLHRHGNAQVRLKAAMATLALDVEATGRILEELSSDRELPQALEASRILRSVFGGMHIDFDLGIVSPRLFEQAMEIGVRTRGNMRTLPLTPRQLRKLRLSEMVRDLTQQTGRRHNVVIYRSKQAMEGRGPSVALPDE